MRCGPAESTHHWGNRTAKHCVATRRRVRTSISERLFPMCADRSSPAAAAATSVSVARTEYKRSTVTQFGRSERKRNESQITSIRDAKYQIPVIPIFQCLLFVFGFSFQRRHPFFPPTFTFPSFYTSLPSVVFCFPPRWIDTPALVSSRDFPACLSEIRLFYTSLHRPYLLLSLRQPLDSITCMV